MSAGGKRENAGRKLGSVNRVKIEIREAAQQYTQEALDTLVSIMQDKDAPSAVRLNAANLIIERAAGKAREDSPAVDVVSRFIEGDISAIRAALELEAYGLKVGATLGKYAEQEVKQTQHRHKLTIDQFDVTEILNPTPEPLPNIL